MSGPKTSRYTLTVEQRRVLAEQRKIEKRKAIAYENIKTNMKRLLKMKGIFHSDKTVALELKDRKGTDNGFFSKMTELDELINHVRSISENLSSDDVDYLEEISNKVGKHKIKANQLLEEITDISSKNEYELKMNLSSDIDKGNSTSFVDVVHTNKKSHVDEFREKICLELASLCKKEILSSEYKLKIEEIIEKFNNIADENFLKNYYSLTITPLIKQCNKILTDYTIYQKEFEKLYTEYRALCELYYFIPQKYQCTYQDITMLKKEIKRINDLITQQEEQKYISESLDEIMEEMGYSVLGSREITKKNGKHFHNELYSYAKGAAVNITYSSDGKITMELGGTDTSDRIPDENEAYILCQHMESFCKDFKEIEKQLLFKGIIVKERICLLPPTQDYAQIINTSEYNTDVDIEKVESKKQCREIKKLKLMRRE